MKPQRRICDFTTSRRRITKVKANGPTYIIIGPANKIKDGRVDLDTHADTILFGQSFILLSLSPDTEIGRASYQDLSAIKS